MILSALIWLSQQDDTVASPAADTSASPSVTSASPDAPSPSSVASPEASSPGPSETKLPPTATSTPSNDPGDGVARDSPAPAPTATQSDSRIIVTVVPTWVSTSTPLEISGYAQHVLDDNSTCTLRAVQAGVQLTASGPGHTSAQDTICGDGLRIDDPRLSQGSWSITLAFDSARYHGESPAQIWERK